MNMVVVLVCLAVCSIPIVMSEGVVLGGKVYTMLALWEKGEA